MARRSAERTTIGMALVLCLGLGGCLGTEDGADGGRDARPAKLVEGLTALRDGEAQAASEAFAALAAEPGQACVGAYGQGLAVVLRMVDRLDVIADAAAVFLGAAPGLTLQQSFDLEALLDGLLEPFEEDLGELAAHMRVPVVERCVLHAPEGLTIELGNPETLLDVRAVLGDDWDEPAARAILAGADAGLAVLHAIRAHDLRIDGNGLTDALDVVNAALDDLSEVQVGANGAVTQRTYISVARAAGAFAVLNRDLLALDDPEAMALVDDDLKEMWRTIYRRDGGEIDGIDAALVRAAAADDDLSDNVVAWLDGEEANGVVGSGDTVRFGIKELRVAGLFEVPQLVGGVEIHLSPALGDVDEAIELIHEIVDVLGDQMAAVDDPGEDYRRLGLSEVNGLIDAFRLTRSLLVPLPEAVEADFRAYFLAPVGLRELVPVWYDDDGDDDTVNVFAIEGEAWVTSAVEPYVALGDAPHFPAAVTMDLGRGTVERRDDLAIDPDGVEPTERSAYLNVPLPYAAWRDPSFAGILYVDRAALPYGDGVGGIALADQAGANHAGAAYVRFVMEEWLNP